VMASTNLSVSNKTVTSLAVTPSTVSVIAGQTQQLVATATFSDGTTSDVTSQASWSSSATGIATVSSSGLVSGVAMGTAGITASYGGQSGSSTVTVQ
jgi:uncharacterized protein YjdB